jgi:amidase
LWDPYLITTDNAEVMKGGKIGLQCIGRKQEEEAVIRMTEIVDAAVRLARKEK